MKNVPGEVILELLAEGGSVRLLGTRVANGWRFRRFVGDWTPALIDEEAIQHESDWVASWEAALVLLDAYPWHKLSPRVVHPEFREQVWAAVQRKFERDRSDSYRDRALGRWRERCKRQTKQQAANENRDTSE